MRSVQIDPKNRWIRKSRGLARALTGNIDGLVEDLEKFTDSEENAEVKEQWQGWIDALKKGENPFTDEVLESLEKK